MEQVEGDVVRRPLPCRLGRTGSAAGQAPLQPLERRPPSVAVAGDVDVDFHHDFRLHQDGLEGAAFASLPRTFSPFTAARRAALPACRPQRGRRPGTEWCCGRRTTDTTRRDIVEDGTTGCVAHTIEAARRTMADPASRKILLAFVRDDEGTAVARALGLGPDDTAQFLNGGLTLRPEHRAG
ncbi:hypothetical protein [Streptomyces africanus]|uniref:hypothetical protein n=1 Tax=Streptomyces africanus TaxID=231024 RepID=UPI00130214B2|nr:hypothetical protein [Streptomyces africanus]